MGSATMLSVSTLDISTETTAVSTDTTAEATALSDNATSQLFRSEALAHYTGGRRRQGDLLRLTPAWTRWSYWLLVAVLLLGLAGATVGTVDQYSSGPAVVKMDEDGATIVALLPGHLRPLLRPGMILRFTLDGYPQAYQSFDHRHHRGSGHQPRWSTSKGGIGAG